MSNLAHLQQGGSLNGQLAQLAEVKTRKESKRDSVMIKKQESTEKLLVEKDEEIKRMQAMIQAMQSQLQASGSGAPSLNSTDSTMV